jgi:HAD superfamily hydrolase (TIGR01458 family)
MIANLLAAIRGFLLDLDGVFHVGDRLLPGAIEALDYLRANKIPYRFTTNTTTRSRQSLTDKLNRIGLSASTEEIISAPYAAILYLRRIGNPSCHLVLADDAKQDFAEFKTVDNDPDVIVLGDIGERWNYGLLNGLFRMMMNGAELIALHKGRYWQVEDGLQMDIGAFVAGLEYVTGKTATVIGKPSASFFQLAVGELGLPVGQVAMIGDDIVSDVGGAQKAGLRGILVKTGKYRPELAGAFPIQPDFALESIADLVSMRSTD